jgi:hypothetical protein
VLSWEEIGVTLFITSVNAVTLPRMMWMGLRDNIDPAIAAISVVLIMHRHCRHPRQDGDLGTRRRQEGLKLPLAQSARR